MSARLRVIKYYLGKAWLGGCLSVLLTEHSDFTTRHIILLLFCCSVVLMSLVTSLLSCSHHISLFQSLFSSIFQGFESQNDAAANRPPLPVVSVAFRYVRLCDHSECVLPLDLLLQILDALQQPWKHWRFISPPSPTLSSSMSHPTWTLRLRSPRLPPSHTIEECLLRSTALIRPYYPVLEISHSPSAPARPSQEPVKETV